MSAIGKQRGAVGPSRPSLAARHAVAHRTAGQTFRDVAILARTALQPNGCRLWTGKVSLDGYPRLHRQDLHRVVCELAHGPPPPKAEACHSAACETHGRQGRACLEPSHLRWASRASNARDRGAHAATRAPRIARVQR